MTLQEQSSSASPRVLKYIAHARSHGSDSIYEVAIGDLRADELVELVLGLPTAVRGWKPTSLERTDLARRLLAEGWKVARIASVVGLRKTRLYELRKELDLSTSTPMVLQKGSPTATRATLGRPEARWGR